MCEAAPVWTGGLPIGPQTCSSNCQGTCSRCTVVQGNNGYQTILISGSSV